MKWWAIYTNFPVNVIVRTPHPWRRDSQGQVNVLKTHCWQANLQIWDTVLKSPSPLLTLRSNGLRCSKVKCWAIDTNLSVNAIVRLPHTDSGNNQTQETFLAPSSDKQTHNYDKECSNHHPFLSTLTSKRYSHSKMKWWATLQVNNTVRLPHPWSRDSQGQEKFLVPSADKQTRTYDTEFSNHHPFLSTLRSKGFSHSKKWWAIYTNLPVNVLVRLPHTRRGNSQSQESFLAPSVDK